MATVEMSIALDVDLINAVWDDDAILCERRKTKPNFQVGHTLAVKETWRYIYEQVHYGSNYYGYGGYYGNNYGQSYSRRAGVELMVDSDDPYGQWNYANTMPLQYAVRFLKVTSIEKISAEEYRKHYPVEILYNNRRFSFEAKADAEAVPYDRWFRKGITPFPPVSDVWVVKYEPI